MKVKDLIEHLQTLDQEKGIWVRYDTYIYFAPIPDSEAEKDGTEGHYDENVRKGDYIIIAG